VILDVVVGSSFKYLRDFCPLIAEHLVLKPENPLFFDGPIPFLDFRVQMVVPSFSTLFPNSSRKVVSD